jgi:23S rRNA-/tRNA-specific pseudouridylate synthase
LIGHPIVGDKLYNHGEEFFNDYCQRKAGIEAQLIHPRHALHALALRLTLNGQKRRFKASMPEDFAELLPII